MMKRSTTAIKLLCCMVFMLMLFAISCSVNAEHDARDCPECGRTGNTGNYCGGCAHPAPWIDIESFSQFMANANYETATDYLIVKENYSEFWKLINEDWINESAVTVIESEGIFVFARPDAIVFKDTEGAQPIRTYRFYDKQGNFKLSVSIDYVGDPILAAEIAERLNQEMAESAEGKDSWGYSGKEMRHFACGDA